MLDGSPEVALIARQDGGAEAGTGGRGLSGDGVSRQRQRERSLQPATPFVEVPASPPEMPKRPREAHSGSGVGWRAGRRTRLLLVSSRQRRAPGATPVPPAGCHVGLKPREHLCFAWPREVELGRLGDFQIRLREGQAVGVVAVPSVGEFAVVGQLLPAVRPQRLQQPVPSLDFWSLIYLNQRLIDERHQQAGGRLGSVRSSVLPTADSLGSFEREAPAKTAR